MVSFKIDRSKLENKLKKLNAVIEKEDNYIRAIIKYKNGRFDFSYTDTSPNVICELHWEYILHGGNIGVDYAHIPLKFLTIHFKDII